jgi:release factor glutamine methyltransferase
MSATVGEAVRAVMQRFADAGIAEPGREARLLVALALGVEPSTVLGYPERPLDPSAQGRLDGLTTRRAAGEPYSRLLGRRQFWSLDFALSPDTLDPRPDSETLIESALAHLPHRAAPLKLVDFGTGTGCLLLALLSELPNAWGIGVDILPGAAAAARLNAAALGLAGRALFVVGHWGEAISGEADVILANPPYICSGDIDGLAPEVANHEPHAALDGGNDGLAAFRELAGDMGRLLRRGGIALVEVGQGQAQTVALLMRNARLGIRAIRRDLSGIERVLVLARH